MSVTGGTVWGGRLAVDLPVRAAEEEALHKSVVKQLHAWVPDDCLFWHTPNGGLRQDAVAKKFVALGVRAGIPDLVFLWRGHFFAIELKAARGVVRPVQRQMHDKITHCGGEVYVCRSLPEVYNLLVGMGMPLNQSVRF